MCLSTYPSRAPRLDVMGWLAARGPEPTVETVLLLLLIAPLGMVLVAYNRLALRLERVELAEREISKLLTRRADLVTRVAEIVTVHAEQERAHYHRVCVARTISMLADTSEKRYESEHELVRATRELIERAAHYPGISRDGGFDQLLSDLAETETALGVARRDYNETVGSYEAFRETTPGRLLTVVGGRFTRREYEELGYPGNEEMLRICVGGAAS